MSDAPNVNETRPQGPFGGWKVAASLAAAVAVGGAALYIIPMIKAPKERQQETPGPKPQLASLGRAYQPPPLDRPTVVEEARPAIAQRLAVAPRPRPSQMAVYSRPAPQASQGGRDGAGGPDEPRTIAGMEIRRAETIADASYFLMPGDTIACLTTQPLTERSGARFSASIPNDVLSRTGRRLIPAGSRALGKSISGMDHGERRLAAVFTHIEGPSVPGKPTLFVGIGDGQAGDQLGRVDLEGNIETHAWSRLGTVAAYATLDMVARAGTGVAGNAINDSLNSGGGQTNINLGNFGGMGNARGLAGQAFDHELRRKPTFDRPHAQPCTIFIQQPIDFTDAVKAMRGR